MKFVMEPIRPFFFNIRESHAWAEPVTYILGFVAAALFAYGVYRHVRLWRLGQPEKVPMPWKERIKAFVKFAMLQGRLVPDRYALLMHLSIFFGMVVLFMGTALATLDQDVAHLIFDVRLLKGQFYLYFKLALDIFAVVFLAGLCMAFYRRYVLKPSRLKNLVYPTFPLDSFYMLAILAFIALTGLLVEALRLAASSPPWAHWSPVGNLIAGAFRSVPQDTMRTAHFALWSAHGLAALAFIALIPHSKAFHIVSSAISVFLRNLGAPGALVVSRPEGVEKITDFTWRQLLQFDACTWCGRCVEICPANISVPSFSAKNIILKLDQAMLRLSKVNGKTGEIAAQSLHDSTFTASELWLCTTCRGCEEVCPAFIEQPRAIIDLRRHLVNQGAMDKMLQAALNSLSRYGNSFNKSDRMRPRWAAGLQTKIKDARKEPVEAVWFVGDYASYDPRVIEVTQATARILQQAGLDFGILMEAERNSGNDVRRVGEEGLFEMLRDKNMEAFDKVQWKNGSKLIFTTDPHSYNTLKNEYSFNGHGVTVKHYTELLDELIAKGRLPLKRKLSGRVTFHDPCYLGRYNGVYEPPRRIIRALGLELVEMPRHCERSMCCGAGGGRIWMEDQPDIQERPAENRVKEAAALENVTTLVVACPKDLAMFRDAVKTTGNEGRLAVKDLGELVAEAMKEEQPGAVQTKEST